MAAEPADDVARRGRTARWLLLGVLAGLAGHAPFVLLGRYGHEGWAVVGLALYFLGDPWVSVPAFSMARRGDLRVGEAACAGAVAGGISATVVLLSLHLRGRGMADAWATLVYPAFSSACAAVASVAGRRLRGAHGR